MTRTAAVHVGLVAWSFCTGWSPALACNEETAQLIISGDKREQHAVVLVQRVAAGDDAESVALARSEATLEAKSCLITAMRRRGITVDSASGIVTATQVSGLLVTVRASIDATSVGQAERLKERINGAPLK